MTTNQKTFAEALEKAIAHAGMEVLSGETQLYSLVADFLGNSPQSKQSLNLLRNAIECGVPQRIYSAADKDMPTQTITIAACRKLLIDSYSISEEVAGQFMQGFSTALGWEATMELPSYIKAEPTQPEQQVPVAEAAATVRNQAAAPTSTPLSVPISAPAPTPSPAPAPIPVERSPEEQCAIGNAFFSGKGVRQDYTEALKWFLRAADRGHAVAQYNLGYMYHKGEGVPQEYAEAFVWLKRAAEQGIAVAQTLLGDCYSGGKGVKRDDAIAASWFQRAAEQGNASGQFNLGFCYYYGEGVPKNRKIAKQWLQKAAAQGHESAQKLLRK